MAWFTVFKKKGDGAWSLVQGAVEAEDADLAMQEIVGGPDAGSGEYMLVEVKALRRVKAKTDYDIEPMDPPAEVVPPTAGEASDV